MTWWHPWDSQAAWEAAVLTGADQELDALGRVGESNEDEARARLKRACRLLDAMMRNLAATPEQAPLAPFLIQMAEVVGEMPTLPLPVVLRLLAAAELAFAENPCAVDFTA